MQLIIHQDEDKIKGIKYFLKLHFHDMEFNSSISLKLTDPADSVLSCSFMMTNDVQQETRT